MPAAPRRAPPPLGLRQWLWPADLRAARLVCRHWAAEVGGLFATVALPPALWQGALAPDARHEAEEGADAATAAILGSASSDPDLAGSALRWAAPKLSRQASVPEPRHPGGRARRGGGGGGGGGGAAAGARDQGEPPAWAAAAAALPADPRAERERAAREQQQRRSVEQEQERRRRLEQLAAAFPAARAGRRGGEV